MQKHTQIYLDYFGYGEQDFIPCEVCRAKAVDIHHINGRGKGKDTIDNLMALCRSCHTKAHDSSYVKGLHLTIHLDILQRYNES